MSEDTIRDSGRRVLLWVVAEHDGERLARVSTEVLGRARELAVELNGEVWGVLLGFGVRGLCDELICYGADAVLLGNDPVFVLKAEQLARLAEASLGLIEDHEHLATIELGAQGAIVARWRHDDASSA